MSQTLFIFIMFASATIQICSSTWVGTFEETSACNKTACCCVKGPIGIKNFGGDNFTTNLNYDGLNCATSSQAMNFTVTAGSNFFAIGNGNATLATNKLTFYIESTAGAQDPKCASVLNRKQGSSNNNANNNSGGVNSFTVKLTVGDMLWFVQIPSLMMMMMVVGFN